MAYLGRPIITDKTTKTVKLDSIATSFNGSQTVFTMTFAGQPVYPPTVYNVLLNLNQVYLEPGVAFTINAATLTFTSAPASGQSFFGLVNSQPYDFYVNPAPTTVTATDSILVGSNININTSALTVTSGANTTTLNATGFFTGNSSVNVAMFSTGIRLGSALGLNSNVSNLLENRGGQLFFNGNRIELIGPYGPAVPVYGYALGGDTGARVVTGNRLTFSTSATAAVTTTNLSQARRMAASMSDTEVYGYALGGFSTAVSAVGDRITFSTSTTAAVAGSNLSQARSGAAGFSDGQTYGYALGGGTDVNGVTAVNTGDRLTFSTSATAALTTVNLSAARHSPAGVSDGAVYGYAMGGLTASTYSAVTDRVAFATSVLGASTIANLSLARNELTGVSDGAVYGYAMGGTSAARTATTNRITFSTGVTAASTISNLSAARSEPAGVSDGILYGYALGGDTGAFVTTTDRINFTSSITAASTVSNLSQARGSAAGISDGAV